MNQDVTAIVGEIEAGHAAKVRTELENLLQGITKTTFDIADLMYEVKTKSYFAAWGFNTFKEYIESQNFKSSKAYYLIRIVDVMKQVGVAREKYEPLGIGKLREIVRLDPDSNFNGNPMKDYIVGLVENGQDKTLEQIRELVRGLQGLTGEDELVWLNLNVKRSALTNTIRPALDLAKQIIGSGPRDEDGNAKDASDGAAIEAVAVEFLNDPANIVLAHPQPEGEVNAS